MKSSVTSATELSFLKGATGNIQAQLDARALINGTSDITMGSVLYLSSANMFVQRAGAAMNLVTPAGGSVQFYSGGALRAQANAAGFVVSSIAAGDRALYADANKIVQSSITSANELGYLKGATGNIQAQLNTLTSDKQDVITSGTTLTLARTNYGDTSMAVNRASAVLQVLNGSGPIEFLVGGVQRMLLTSTPPLTYLQTPVVHTYLNTNTVPFIDTNKVMQSSAVGQTELGYLKGATSNIQAQLNTLTSGKQNTITGTTDLAMRDLNAGIITASTRFQLVDSGVQFVRSANLLQVAVGNSLDDSAIRFFIGTMRANITKAGTEIATALTVNWGGTPASNIFDMTGSVAAAGNYIRCTTGAVNRFRVAGNGAVYGALAYSVGADYAEYFEWEDGNPEREDRRAKSVVLAGNNGTIDLAERQAPPPAPEDIIGVVSVAPSVVGDSAWSTWKCMCLTDEYGAVVTEPKQMWEVDGPKGAVQYEPGAELPEDVDPANVRVVTVQAPVLNPAYDPSQVYVPRAERPEWAPVGLMGKLRVRAGQPVGARWKLLRHLSPTMNEYLVM